MDDVRGGKRLSMPSLDQEAMDAAVAALPDGALSALRNQAAKIVRADGFPSTRNEDWKYTNLTGAAKVSNAWLASTDATTATSIDKARYAAAVESVAEQVNATWIVLRNGHVDASEIAALNLPAGISVSSLAADSEVPDLAMDTAMSAFNAALLVDGIRIRVAAGCVAKRPLGLLIADDPGIGVSQHRVIVEVESGAQLQLLEYAASVSDGAQFSNTVIEVSIAADATVRFARIQRRHAGHIGTHRLSADIGAGANFTHNAYDFGGELSRNDVVCRINGAGAHVDLSGLFLTGGQQHVDNHTRVEHRVGPATSNEIYRGILSGHSRGVFNGQAIVSAGADGTDANQANHNLLLSPAAEIDTKPELEIYADDVKCSHGATVGQLDAQAMHYLRTRGLDPAEARALLTRAFATEVIDSLTVDAADTWLRQLVDERLGELLDESLRDEAAS